MCQGYIEYYTSSEEYEPVQVPIPPLVTEVTWRKAQEILDNGDQTQALFHELREEEDELRAKLLTHTISTEFIDHWERYAQSLGKGIAQFSFEQKCEALYVLLVTSRSSP